MLGDNEYTKALSTEALGEIRDNLKVVAKAFSDVLNENPNSPSIQLGIISSLQKLNVASEDSVSALIKAISNENITVKLWAKEALMALGGSATVYILNFLQTSEDKKQLIEYIIEIGDCAIPELITAFKNAKNKKDLETYRADIVLMMGEIAGQSKNEKVRTEVKEMINLVLKSDQSKIVITSCKEALTTSLG